jgi:diphthamide synthase (EF-2-diphthine--ammonia ligase)
MKAYINWSGGKDSSLALYHTFQSAVVEDYSFYFCDLLPQ